MAARGEQAGGWNAPQLFTVGGVPFGPAEAVYGVRREALPEGLGVSPYTMGEVLGDPELQAEPEAYAPAVAVGALLALSGNQDMQRVFGRARGNIARALVAPRGNRLASYSYLFDDAAQCVASGNPTMPDLVLVAASAQNVVEEARPYRPAWVAHHARQSRSGLEDIAVGLTGLAKREGELQKALAAYVKANHRREFVAGQPHVELLVWRDIARGIGLFDSPNPTRTDPIRDGVFQLIQHYYDAVKTKPDYRLDKDGKAKRTGEGYEAIPDMWEFDAIEQFLEDRREGLPLARLGRGRLWRFLTFGPEGGKQYLEYLKECKARIPDANFNYRQGLGLSSAEFEFALGESLAEDGERVGALWAALGRLCDAPHLASRYLPLARRYQRAVTRVMEPELRAGAELMRAGHEVPMWVLEAALDNYLQRRPQYRALAPGGLFVLTEQHGSLNDDYQLLGEGLSRWLGVGLGYRVYSPELDYAAAYRLLTRNKGLADRARDRWGEDDPRTKARVLNAYLDLQRLNRVYRSYRGKVPSRPAEVAAYCEDVLKGQQGRRTVRAIGDTATGGW